MEVTPVSYTTDSGKTFSNYVGFGDEWDYAEIVINGTVKENLSHIRNEGVAFGMLQGGRWAFVALLGVFCALVLWALCTGKLTASWERWLAVLAMGGALSNGIDRAVYGYVTDMLELEFMRFAVFNVADCFICVCAVLYMALTLFRKSPEEKE